MYKKVPSLRSLIINVDFGFASSNSSKMSCSISVWDSSYIRKSAPVCISNLLCTADQKTSQVTVLYNLFLYELKNCFILLALSYKICESESILQFDEFLGALKLHFYKHDVSLKKTVE